MSNAFFSEEAGSEVNTQEEAIVILRFGTEEVEILPSELTPGMTIQQLVALKAEDLGVDPERISSFRDEGVVVPPTTTVREGRLYSVALTAESKGIN